MSSFLSCRKFARAYGLRHLCMWSDAHGDHLEALLGVASLDVRLWPKCDGIYWGSEL